ncbi:hypothetical protein BDZ89DRAFT_1063360 [Hymenopellis radicata]|nr:hypothetical protein BDZ89DRAFT_1063360 [Hymenopellis radicata]
MAWELFDVTRTRHVGDWTKYLPDDLERKSKVLLKLTHIHPLVRTVRVLLTRRRTPEVLGTFAKCLEKLTSVTKLEITHAHTAMTTHLKNAFEGYTFPSIRTAILPAQAHNVLRCCTGVRSVTVNDMNHECSKLITAIGAACPAVEEVVDFHLDTGNNLKSLIKGAPNLRSIHLQHPPSKDTITSLKPFKKLKQLGATKYLKDTRTFTVKDPPVPLTFEAVLKFRDVQDFIVAAGEFLKERGGGRIVIDHRLLDQTSSSPNTQVVLSPYWTHTVSVE